MYRALLGMIQWKEIMVDNILKKGDFALNLQLKNVLIGGIVGIIVVTGLNYLTNQFSMKTVLLQIVAVICVFLLFYVFQKTKRKRKA